MSDGAMGLVVLVGITVPVAIAAHVLTRRSWLPRLARPFAFLLASGIAGCVSSVLFVLASGLQLGYLDPFWPIALAFGTVYATGIAIVVGLFISLRSRPEPREGHCAGCGYDLTGNISGVCPECGREIWED